MKLCLIKNILKLSFLFAIGPKLDEGRSGLRYYERVNEMMPTHVCALLILSMIAILDM